jgi:hypothetical protein
LIEESGLNAKKDLPAFVVFAPSREGEFYKRVIKFSDTESPDTVFETLRMKITIIAEALDNMDKKYFQKKAQAFHTVGYALDGHEEWERIKGAAKFLPLVKEIIKIIK